MSKQHPKPNILIKTIPMNKKKLYILVFLPLTIWSQVTKKKTNDKANLDSNYYYNDGVLAIGYWFGNDKIIDSLKTYYSSGLRNEIFYYDGRGLKNGECFQYGVDGEKVVSWNFEHGKLLSRIDHKLVFNKNTEEKVKKLHAKLSEINTRTHYNPTTFSDLFRRACIRYQLKNTTLALQDLKVLEAALEKCGDDKNKISIDKNKAIVYDMLAEIYAYYENENTAIHYYYKALKIEPNSNRLMNNLGGYLFDIKSYKLAIYYLEKAIEIKPKHAFANWTLGLLYSDLEEYEKALKYINIAFEREETIIERSSVDIVDRDIRTTRGLLYHKLGDSKKGIVDLTDALEINKNNSYAMKNLGIIYLDLNEKDKACKLFQRAKELHYKEVHDNNDLNYYLDKSCYFITPEPLAKANDMPYIYPNPSTDIIFVKNYEYKTFEFEIYNYDSILVHKGSSIDGSIGISNLDSGLYIIKILNTGSPQTFKIIKE